MQVASRGQVVAPGNKTFEPLQECRTDCQGVGESTVHRTGLFDQDPSVAFEDMSRDFADVVAHQGFDGLLSGENARARLANAYRAE